MTHRPFLCADLTRPLQNDVIATDGLLKLNAVRRVAVGTAVRNLEFDGSFRHWREPILVAGANPTKGIPKAKATDDSEALHENRT